MFLICPPSGGYPGLVRTGGGLPQPGQDVGYPNQVRMGGAPTRDGVPPSTNGVPPIQRWGTPGQGWGTLCPEMGTPWPGMGPPVQRWGTPPLARDGALPPPPRIGQQMEYLICHGRYTSCVHTGGLSCNTCSLSYSKFTGMVT